VTVAVIVAGLAPAQIAAELTATTGRGLTVMVFVADPLQPAALVTVTE
jgi:hypothetical protein